jgi:hypothetical protein
VSKFFPGSPRGLGVPFRAGLNAGLSYSFSDRIAVEAPTEEQARKAEIQDVEQRTAALAEYGWSVRFVEEPDGSVTGHLEDYESKVVLKTVAGFDFEDAYLGLGVGTTPPSPELRGEREDRSGE